MKAGTRQRGFTLIEVLLVILILGMLATVAVVALSGTREGAREDAAKILISNISNKLEVFNQDMTRYPTAEEGLKALISKPATTDEKSIEKWRGPYWDAVPVDPWGHELNYELLDSGSGTPAEGQKPYKLWSNGKDGQSGTADDIKNWQDETK